MNEEFQTKVKQAVRNRYASLALLKQPCCADAPSLTSKDAPEESLVVAASCGSPVAHSGLHEGEVVLDLGSGGGIDVFRASKLVGSSGKVIGVDSTQEMIFKAREVAAKYGYGNVEFRLGEIEQLPIETNSVDVVISNCVLNLVPDKTLAFREIYRVLKPGGRITISDMVTTGPERKRSQIDPEEWASCIAGAIPVDEYQGLLLNTGFREISWLRGETPFGEACCSSELSVESVTWLAAKPKRPE